MTICYFGIYNPGYSRNKILISGLRQNDVEVIECRTDKRGILKYFDLIRKHWSIRKGYDLMVVGYPGFQSVILARLLTSKPIIFDAFLSMYDSMVLDRKQVSANSLRARYYWWLDKISALVTDLVLIDTVEHKSYLSDEFGVSDKKVEVVYIGADTDIFYPTSERAVDNIFRVLFFGTFIPLQGIEYILRAAKLLENERDIAFEIIGDGQEKIKMVKLAEELKCRNLVFRDFYPQSELRSKIISADICLGIFGNTEKAKRVIPNKVYECLAMKKLVITADTPAMREIFDEKEVIFTKIADENSIAEAILLIKGQPKLAMEISENGYNKFTRYAAPTVLGFRLKFIAEELYGKSSK